MKFINPLLAFIIALAIFASLLYKRIGLGVSLCAAALVLGLLTIGPVHTLSIIIKTLMDYDAQTVIFASFAIMLLSQLYKETSLINTLTESLSGLIRNSKVILALVPAVIGLMPVAGGALMSAPMVEEEAKKLKLDQVRKAYVNIWFRHTIFPIYPISQLLILTAALTGTSMYAVIFRQIPIVMGMVAVGYFIGLRKTELGKQSGESERVEKRSGYLRSFLFSFSPILVIIALTIALGNVSVSAFIGVLFLIFTLRVKRGTLSRILKNWSVYEVVLAAFGAFLLRNATETSGLSSTISGAIIKVNFNEAIFLIFLPLILAFLMGSPSGGISVSVPIVSEIVNFTAKSASLLYMSAYLGYLFAPTHLCLVFTVEYFKTSLSETYKYMLPSVIFSMALAFLVYLFIPA